MSKKTPPDNEQKSIPSQRKKNWNLENYQVSLSITMLCTIILSISTAIFFTLNEYYTIKYKLEETSKNVEKIEKKLSKIEVLLTEIKTSNKKIPLTEKQ